MFSSFEDGGFRVVLSCYEIGGNSTLLQGEEKIAHVALVQHDGHGGGCDAKETLDVLGGVVGENVGVERLIEESVQRKAHGVLECNDVVPTGVRFFKGANDGGALFVVFKCVEVAPKRGFCGIFRHKPS